MNITLSNENTCFCGEFGQKNAHLSKKYVDKHEIASKNSKGTAPTAAGGNGALLRVDCIFKIFSCNMKESFRYEKI